MDVLLIFIYLIMIVYNVQVFFKKKIFKYYNV